MNFLLSRNWNTKVLEPHAECIARSGARTHVSHSSEGQVIDLTGSALWRHPWFTDPAWNPKQNRWEATVNPGLVNGEDPLVPGAEIDGLDEPGLLDAKALPLHRLRSVPGEEERVDPYFAALGVREPENPFSISALGRVTLGATTREDENPLPPRALVAMDFYLTVARATYEPQVSVVDASGTSGQVVDYSVTFNTDNLRRVGPRARLMQAAKFPAPRIPTFQDRLAGDYQAEGEDRQLVSTVYLLSPPNQLAGEPDATWTPYVRHAIFWNLAHAARNLPPQNAKPQRFQGTGLPLADMLIGPWLALQNELYQKVLNAFNTTSNEGRFWTV